MEGKPGSTMDEPDGLPPLARRRAIITMTIAVAISVLSTAIANIALPTMAQELQASPAAAIWVVNAYQLAVTVSLLPLASLGDIRGYRVVYLWGLVVFTLASIACGLAGRRQDGAAQSANRRGRNIRRWRFHQTA